LSWAHRRLKTVDVEYEAKRTRVSWATAIDVVGDRPDVVVCAMRQRANLFGHNVKRWDALPLSQRIGEVIKGTPPQGLLEAVGLAVKSKIADPPVADVASSLSQWVGSIESAVAGAQTSFSLLPDPGDLPGLRSASARLSSARDKISAPASPPDGWFPDFPGALNDMVDAAVSLGDATVEMAMRLPAAADAVGAAVSKTGSAYLQLRVREAQGYLHLMTNVGAALQDVAVRMQRGEDTRIAGPYAEMREHWADANLDKTLTHVFLDAQYANLAAGSWIVLASREETILRRVETVDDLTHSAYDLTLKVTRLGIDSPLAKGFSPWSANVLLKSERLALARPPRSSAVSGESIELDRRIHGFEAGRRVVIEGVLVGGGKGAESAILDRAEVTTDATTLYLRTSLRNSYQRGGCRVLGNVALATHGEAVHDVLGSGDASTANQVFALKQGPLTFVAAENELGAATTLEVRVADERWLEVSTLVGRGPTDHVYTSARSRDGRTTVSFGDGVEGARLPTGTNSVRARYRKGVGLSGNVKAEQISQLMTKPLGLASARNPVEANGGDDAASAEHLRSGAPTSVHTLGRVVSLVDYEDFARAFAGIAKAHSRWASGDGIVVTIAGPGGLIIPAGGATENALVNALRAAGEPFLSVSIVPHRSRAASISGRVVIDPAFDAEVVRQSIEARMRTDFGFAARSFGQSLRSSEVVASLHAVRGVVAVDIDLSLSAPPQSGSGAILITLADSPLDLEIAR
ncbi:MAG: baseplate J/gp47 family protein, partial [Phycisphaerae bacterium]|nr:baseplate J/gp47 family protein [Phycisphaerae bacterium]